MQESTECAHLGTEMRYYPSLDRGRTLFKKLRSYTLKTEDSPLIVLEEMSRERVLKALRLVFSVEAIKEFVERLLMLQHQLPELYVCFSSFGDAKLYPGIRCAPYFQMADARGLSRQAKCTQPYHDFFYCRVNGSW